MFNKIKAYIHVAKMNTWSYILSELLEDFRMSKFTGEITLVTVGGDIDPIPNTRVINTGLPLTEFEFPTIKLLKDELEDNTAILYCHLKGVSQPDSYYHQRWRRELSDFTILHWKDRVEHLEDRWTSGPKICNGGGGNGWQHVPAFKHYSGNFWWARSDYIAKLEPIESLRKIHPHRFAAESWIGQSPLINEKIK